MQTVFHFYLNSTGYSIAAQDYVLSILQTDPTLDIKANFFNSSPGLGVSENRKQFFHSLQKKQDSQDCIHIFHSIPHRYRRHKGPKKFIGICLFETINPPPNWISMMNEMDMIITASHFNKRVFESNGVKKPVIVVPHGFDPNLFHKNVKPLGRYRPFTFFSMGTWKKRKNWDTLIKAFYDAFSSRDDVCLYVKTDKTQELRSSVLNIKRTTEWRYKDTAPIYCEDKSNCVFEDIPHIMKKADVCISTSLGEGFGYVGAHAMALGIPLITTRFGGTLEYAKPDLCTHIEPYQYISQPIMDNIPQFKNCIWPAIKISEVRDKMLYAFRQRNEIAVKAEKAYEYIHSNFSYQTIGKKFLAAIDQCLSSN